MKKTRKDHPPFVWCSLKTLIIMKAIFLLLLVSAGQLWATEVYSQRVTIQMKNASFKQITRAIEKQTNLTFLYNDRRTSRLQKKDVNVVNADFTRVMKNYLQGSNLSYELVDQTVIIMPIEEMGSDIQQQLKINGTVKDTLGRSISGVSVSIKNTTLKTVTNQNGQFALLVPQRQATLIFSFIGMKTQEIVVRNNMLDLQITLSKEDVAISDVVVTGYNNIKKESFTGNAISIGKEQLLRTNPHNLIDALQTFDPSFRITENLIWGSNPNALPEFTIRGESSIGMDKSLEAERLKQTQRTNLKDNPNLPIFILDGFEVDVQTVYDMDINRIESVNILKDAAATAMYGSRAANGVLVITSIAPRPGEMRVTYNLTGGFEFPDLSDYNLTNAAEKLEAELAAGVYNMNEASGQIDYNNIYNRILQGVNTDWLAQPLRNAFNQKHSLYIDGGVETIRYALNFSHDNNNGAMKGSYRDRSGAGLTFDFRNDKLQIKNQFQYNSTRMAESPYGTFDTYTKQQPYEPVFDENGEYLEHLSGLTRPINPLWYATLDSYNGKGYINEFQNNLSANWQIIPHLQFKGQVSVTKIDDKTETYVDPTSMIGYSLNQRGTLDQEIGSGYNWNVNALAYYNQQIDKHFINATAGINIRETFEDAYNMEFIGFQLGKLHGPTFAAQQPDKSAYSSAKTRLFGSLASVNYSYDNTYLLDASLRLDGSSQFGSDEKIAPFWAVGLGLNLHRYPWLATHPFISLLKVRGSYGTTGKVNFPPYTAITSYDINADSWYYTGPSASIVYLGNPALKWETTKTLDVGFEWGVLTNRFVLRATYYNKETEGLIDQVSIAPSSGFATYRANSGTIVNKGFELDLNTVVVQTPNWVVAVRGTFASNKNRITELGTASQAYNEAVNEQYNAQYGNKALQTVPLTRYYVGASTTAIYAVPSAGIDPANGRERFIKQNGTSTYTWSAADQIVVGDTRPDAQGSFGLNASYRGFYVNASFLYQWGAQTYNTTLLTKVENVDITRYNVDRRVLTQRWKKPGDITPFLNIAANRTTRPTSRFVQNYDYLRFNALSLGYDVKSELLKRWKIATLGFRVNMNDPFHWSTVRQERGTSYPYAKVYSFTLNIGI